VSADDVLKARTCVCTGYANLFEALCRAAGLEAVVITGHARGAGIKTEQGLRPNHAWNAVKIDGHWRLIEATWGAGHLQGRNFVKQFEDFFFLPPPEQLIFTHFPDDARWQLLGPPLTRDQFARLPRVERHLFKMFARFPALADVQKMVAEGRFRGFAKPYGNPQNTRITIHEGPVEKNLRGGGSYRTWRSGTTAAGTT
jgi:hypothetical protein